MAKDLYAEHKYPAHSVRTKPAARKEPAAPVKQPPSALRLGLVGLVLFGLLVAGMWGVLKRQPPSSKPVALAVSEPIASPAATSTQAPTASPWPSATLTRAAQVRVVEVEVTRVVEVEVSRVVEVVVEHIITATPAPWTPSATPPPTATALPLWLVKANHEAEMSMRKAQISLRLAEYFLAPASIVVFLVVLGGICGVLFLRRWSTQKLDEAAAYETRAEIEQRTDLSADAGLGDMLVLLRESSRLYGPGEQRLVGWRDMAQLGSKWTADYWSAVIKDLEAVGLRTFRQSGVGTYLANNTIRTATLYVMRMQTPSPTGGGAP